MKRPVARSSPTACQERRSNRTGARRLARFKKQQSNRRRRLAPFSVARSSSTACQNDSRTDAGGWRLPLTIQPPKRSVPSAPHVDEVQSDTNETDYHKLFGLKAAHENPDQVQDSEQKKGTTNTITKNQRQLLRQRSRKKTRHQRLLLEPCRNLPRTKCAITCLLKDASRPHRKISNNFRNRCPTVWTDAISVWNLTHRTDWTQDHWRHKKNVRLMTRRIAVDASGDGSFAPKFIIQPPKVFNPESTTSRFAIITRSRGRPRPRVRNDVRTEQERGRLARFKKQHSNRRRRLAPSAHGSWKICHCEDGVTFLV